MSALGIRSLILGLHLSLVDVSGQALQNESTRLRAASSTQYGTGYDFPMCRISNLISILQEIRVNEKAIDPEPRSICKQSHLIIIRQRYYTIHSLCPPHIDSLALLKNIRAANDISVNRRFWQIGVVVVIRPASTANNRPFNAKRIYGSAGSPDVLQSQIDAHLLISRRKLYFSSNWSLPLWSQFLQTGIPDSGRCASALAFRNAVAIAEARRLRSALCQAGDLATVRARC